MATAGPRAEPRSGTVLQVRRTLPASRERVFEAWLDPEQLRRWLTGPRGESPHAEVDARVGGEFRIAMQSPLSKLLGRLPGPYEESVYMVGRYVEIIPPERLAFTMGWESFPGVHLDRDATLVTIEFHDRGAETELVLTHERQPNRRVHAFHRYGWKGSLRKLGRLLENERPTVLA